LRSSGSKRGLYAGLDLGAAMTKAIIMDGHKNILGSAVLPSGTNFRFVAKTAMAKAEAAAGLTTPRYDRVITTGYGRSNVLFADATRTEISCHAKGSYHHFPWGHVLVDIGGQDSKIIKIDAAGQRTDFKMNRKCAAGTGAFLEDIARRLRISLKRFDGLARTSTRDVALGSYCTVFTATEILMKIRLSVATKDIIKGLYKSVVKRILEMDVLEGPVVLSGGVVAHHPFLVTMFEAELGRGIHVPPLPQFTGALGAALVALETRGDQGARSAV
jgi:predicted CoA-substrate-specific enzyme activase